MLLVFAFVGCATSRSLPDDVLDDFHDAASKADEERYFSHFATEGVFLGTDATERWTVEEFRKYVHPYFSKGKGWTYVPRERRVGIDGAFAWFDEVLDNESYGELRGSGSMRRIAGEWKILQYNLTFLVPNDKAKRVVDVIRSR